MGIMAKHSMIGTDTANLGGLLTTLPERREFFERLPDMLERSERDALIKAIRENLGYDSAQAGVILAAVERMERLYPRRKLH